MLKFLNLRQGYAVASTRIEVEANMSGRSSWRGMPVRLSTAEILKIEIGSPRLSHLDQVPLSTPTCAAANCIVCPRALRQFFKGDFFLIIIQIY